MKLVIDIDKKKYKRIIKNFKTFPKEMKEWGLEEVNYHAPKGTWLLLNGSPD